MFLWLFFRRPEQRPGCLVAPNRYCFDKKSSGTPLVVYLNLLIVRCIFLHNDSTCSGACVQFDDIKHVLVMMDSLTLCCSYIRVTF